MVVVLNEVSYLKCLTRKCWVVNQCSVNVSGSFDPHNCYCRHRKWWNIELIWRKGILYLVCLSLWSAGGGRKDSKGVGLWPWSARPLSVVLEENALVSFCQLDAIWEGRYLYWEMSPTDQPAGRSVGQFSPLRIDVGGPQSLWVVPPLGQWCWAIKDRKLNKEAAGQ